ncbi:MAG TPA: 30S ribosomal protein S6 [Candidatus Goldiibacteriota bacterium]|jgi:small subunit ribosomal protein S6|nr:30S ribosomal protein S6 [Candidatus Goldiibacteriota bacterium]HPN64398.1 30S ribosomal protein S6 [Candidatus Goldiibacteriota bacterium]HRQ43654.1 30S ribosomal protein S6 [Candidatus Goldiibacteriota bacterium]
MRTYEAIVYLRPTLTEEEIKGVLGKVKKTLDDLKGEVIEEKAPEKKKLHFYMKKFKDAFVYYIKFKVEEKQVIDVREKLRLTEEIIRFMISNEVVIKMKKVKVRKPKKPAADTAAVKPADAPAETPEGGADQE